jgi:hypothetical protein
MEGVSHGNAKNVASSRGWFIGFFVDNDPCRQTNSVEVKWGIHHTGRRDKAWEGNHTARSISILIQGRFRFEFRHDNETQEVWPEDPGDYAVWLPEVEHRGFAEVDNTVMLTIRWPSVPGDHFENPE